MQPEPGTVLVVVVGRGHDADRAEARCRDLAAEPLFEELRVERLREDAWSQGRSPARQLRGPGRLLVVGDGQSLQVPLDRADTLDLLVAISAVSAAA
jgi:hypothetical protein